MSASGLDATVARNVTDEENAFHVLIVYEDQALGRCAMDTYWFLLSQFGNEFDFRLSLWRFDLLQTCPSIGDPVHEAVDADLIIVAVRRRTLPGKVREWLNAWVPHKQGRTAALIALLSESRHLTLSSEAREELKNAATSAGMDFLGQDLPLLRSTPRWESGEPGAVEGWGLYE